MIDYIVSIISAQNFLPLLQLGANPMRVTVRETSKLTSFPVEDGTQRTDHRVIDPIEIELPLLLSSEFNRSLFDQLRQIYLRGDEVVVQTKMRTYDSMMIVEMPHDETPEIFGGVPVSVRLKQVITVQPEFGELPAEKVANPAQSSTVKKGGQQTQEVSAANGNGATERKASTLYRLAN